MLELTAGANKVIRTDLFKLDIEIKGMQLSQLDFSAYVLSSIDQKVRGDDDMIFYGQTKNQDQSVKLVDQDSNTVRFILDLKKMQTDIAKVVICATVANELKNFSSISHLTLNLIDSTGTVATAKILGAQRTEMALILAEFYRYKDNWKFRLVVQGFNGGLKPLAEHFGVEVEEDLSCETPPPLTVQNPASTSSLSSFPSINETQFSQPISSENQKNDFRLPFNNPEIPNLGIKDALKDLFLSPIKAIEKRKKYKEFDQLLIDALADGYFTGSKMKMLQHFCSAHSLDLNEALKASELQIAKFFRFTLANIVADGIVDCKEQAYMDSLCTFFHPPAQLINEIKSTIQRVNQIAKISQGQVTAIRTNAIITKNSEIVWLHHTNVFLKHGKNERLSGDLFVTNERIIYKSTKSFEVSISNIISVDSSSNTVYIAAKTRKGSGDFIIGPEAKLVEAYINQSVKRFHRQLDLKQKSGSTRHIQQSVKNIVWDRCQGKCVQCNSEQYIEFDHIIPFSKGGSNSENNIQILCRRCNLAKSDKI